MLLDDDFFLRENKNTIIKNISFLPFSISDFNELASSKIGFKINIGHGRKICDFRPAFGKIFDNFIIGYDFWGYSDIDLILGDLRLFLDNQLLNELDYIGVNTDYPSGYFSIIKNSKKMNHLFSESKDLKWVFTQKENVLFEECGRYYDEVINGMNILDTNCKFETFHHLLELNKEKINFTFEFFSIEGIPGRIKKSRKKLIFNDKLEIMMYHLCHFKKNIYSKIKKKPRDKYYITKHNIFKYNISSKINYQIELILEEINWLLFKFSSKILTLLKNELKAKIIAGNYYHMNKIISVKYISEKPYLVIDNNYLKILPTYNSKYFFIKNGHSLVNFISIKDKNFMRIVFKNGNIEEDYQKLD